MRGNALFATLRVARSDAERREERVPTQSVGTRPSGRGHAFYRRLFILRLRLRHCRLSEQLLWQCIAEIGRHEDRTARW